jgi:hypothetical protein
VGSVVLRALNITAINSNNGRYDACVKTMTGNSCPEVRTFYVIWTTESDQAIAQFEGFLLFLDENRFGIGIRYEAGKRLKYTIFRRGMGGAVRSVV